MNRLDSLIKDYPLPTWRAFAWPVMIMIVSLAVWANFAKLDEVAVAMGEVVPLGQVKVIQHLEGGIIIGIYVSEGDTVKAGQKLLQLDLSTSGINKSELEVRLDSQILVKARLEAESQGIEVKFPAGVAARRPDQVRAERRNFNARKRQLASNLGVLRQLVKQRQQDIKELLARRNSVAKNLKFVKERFQLSKSLLAKGLTPKMDHLQLQAEVETLQGELAGLMTTIPRARSALSEARQRVEEEKIRFRGDAQEELVKTEQAIARITELLAQATEQKGRAEIKSPINGVVKNMRYYTIGGIVKAGEPIMEIVPTGGNLVIEARLNPTDRGYVTVGQSALVKISTYDYSRYGGLDGKVIMLAPDSSTDENGQPYFRIVAKTEKTYLGEKEGDFPITPGMQASVEVHTGKKSVMEYLIQPVLKLRHEAFRER